MYPPPLLLMKTKESAFRGALPCVWMELSENLVTLSCWGMPLQEVACYLWRGMLMLLSCCSFWKIFTVIGGKAVLLAVLFICSPTVSGNSGDWRTGSKEHRTLESQESLDLNRRTNGSWCESSLFCKMENVITAFVTWLNHWDYVGGRCKTVCCFI